MNAASPMRLAQRWTLVAAVLGSGMVFLDSTVVNVALPRIGQDLGPGSSLGVLEGQSYVYNGYLLSLSALLILAGALSDYYGRRRTFIWGLIGFGTTSLLCGLAPSMELLVLFRLLQGAAGALLVPGSLALLTNTFEGEEQGRAFGVWAGASAMTTILGPLVGGLLVDTVSWRAAFLINLPFMGVALWASYRHVRESRDAQASGAFDWLGSAIVALAVGGLAFGSIYGQQREWRDPIAFVALGVGALATIALPWWMAHARNALVPLELFRSRNFTVTNISTLLIYGALYVTSYYLAIFLQGTLNYTAAAAGLAGTPGGLLLALFSARFGALASRYGPRWFMALGPTLMAVGVFIWSRVSATSTPWQLRPDMPSSFVPPLDYLTQLLPGTLIFGVGLTVMVAPLTTALMTSVPSHRAGVASAVNNAISRVGPQLAGALVFIAITSSFYADLARRVPDLNAMSETVRAQISPLNRPPAGLPEAVAVAARAASADAFQLAMLVGAGLLLCGALVNALGIRKGTTATTARTERDPLGAPAAVDG